MRFIISKIWTVQWVETDEAGTYTPIVEIHLSYNSAMNRVSQLVGISPDKFLELRGYPTILASGISMSEYRI